jgi:hypothetical protein
MAMFSLVFLIGALLFLFWGVFHPDAVYAAIARRSRRRLIWRLRLFYRKYLSSKDGHKVKRPKNLSTETAQAIRLWGMAIHREDSLLLYNPVTGESYVELVDADCPVYLFLERGNLRIVNTVVGYDVPLQNDAEAWCSQMFSTEVHRRRTTFKATANSKVAHSLDLLESKLRESSKRSKP